VLFVDDDFYIGAMIILTKSPQNAISKISMPENSSEIIYPCPLSKGYGIPNKQAWLLLRVFLVYRLILASLFILLFYSQVGSTLLNIHHHDLFTYSSRSYLVLSLVSAVCIIWKLTPYIVQAQLLIITDIIILTLIMHAYGGISSGIGVLLAVSIASAGLLIGGRCAMFFAALASLAVIAEQFYTEYTNNFELGPYAYIHAGMLGASFFTISLLSFVLAKRGEQMLQLANQQEQVISNLEELNQYIIQHLQSGIIITNQQQVIQLGNEAALRLTNLINLPFKLSDISEQLATAFQTWLIDNEQTFLLLRIGQSDIQVRFMPLPTRYKVFYMIILEDSLLYNQRLQQGKLASLGRLTASIAHEIRNPLSAINHAGQLLSENPDLPPEDLRLTHIIQTNAARVNHIIEDILQLSRRKDSRREKLELNEWLDNYLKTFVSDHKIAPPHSFVLSHPTEPLFVYIDPHHLKQIMDNLCQNALKYGQPEAGPIRLQALMIQQSPCIEIIDNGAGISLENMRHLFEPFFTTSASGTGLGLYISKELAELNQAKLIYYVTAENKCCFRLCLFNADHTLIEI
jgi:two-component system sensor histidine kinase PilS (NtrC family)